MKIYELRRKQTLPIDIETAWSFFSDAKNLAIITPKSLDFQITNLETLPKDIYPGMIIQYTVTPMLGLKRKWVTEITHAEVGKYFVDEMRLGPYSLWHHEHHFYPEKDGVTVVDIVHYKLPFGILGRMIHYLYVKRKLDEIFAFREQALREILSYNP